MSSPAIAYYRVSTARQGQSGLGLDAQRQTVQTFAASTHRRLIAERVEVESGTKAARPMLADAMRLCRLHRATLLIAKLDRLARNVAFTSQLLESGIDFVACDFPQANRFTIHILAAMAEHETVMVSARTREALAAAKARGVQLGGDRAGNFASIAPAGRAAGTAAILAKSKARALDVLPIIEDVQAGGASTLRAIAEVLNARGIPAAEGGRWSATQVQRVMVQAAR